MTLILPNKKGINIKHFDDSGFYACDYNGPFEFRKFKREYVNTSIEQTIIASRIHFLLISPLYRTMNRTHPECHVSFRNREKRLTSI